MGQTTPHTSCMTDLAEKIILNLKQNNITPIPRWKFLLKNGCVWGGALLFTLGSATGIATSIHIIRSNDWDIYQEVYENFERFAITTIPYAWIGIVMILIGICYTLFIRTRHGYRYRLVAVTSGGLIVSSILGSILYAAGVGSYVDEYVREKAPSYHLVLNPHARTWYRPEQGFIGGNVVEKHDNVLSILDERGELWQVELNVTSSSIPASIEERDRIRIIGTMIGKNRFSAHKIADDKSYKKTQRALPSKTTKKDRKDEILTSSSTTSSAPIIIPNDKKNKPTTDEETPTSSTSTRRRRTRHGRKPDDPSRRQARQRHPGSGNHGR